MKLLLDTHVMYWWLRDSPKLGARGKAILASPKAELIVSTASFWELTVKSRLGKMPHPGSALMREAMAGGMVLLDLTQRHLEIYETIEQNPRHKDPFDLLILSQAIAENAILVTRDRKLLEYDVPAVRIG